MNEVKAKEGTPPQRKIETTGGIMKVVRYLVVLTVAYGNLGFVRESTKKV